MLDGLYDPDNTISKLFGIRTEVMGEIIWSIDQNYVKVFTKISYTHLVLNLNILKCVNVES